MFSTFLTAAAFASGSAPVAEAGLPLIAYVGDTVILDGSGSSDREGDPLSWEWTQLSGPPVDIERADSVEPTLSISAAGTLRIQLVVSDGSNSSEGDAVEIVVPYEEVEVETGCNGGGSRGFSALGLSAALLLFSRRQRLERG